jgi:periplasmic protein TonB
MKNLVIMLLLVPFALHAQEKNKSKKTSPCEQLLAGNIEQPLKSSDSKPEFPDGEGKMKEFVRKHLVNDHVQAGTVYITCVVTADGKIQSAKVIKGLSEQANKEALRVVALMPAWKPGMCGETAVAVETRIAIEFRIE